MLWSLLRMLSRIGEPRMTSREQQRQWMEDALTQAICEGAARETMLVRRGLLPENWKESGQYDFDQIKRMHETEMRRDRLYREDYKAELEAARREDAERRAKLITEMRESGLSDAKLKEYGFLGPDYRVKEGD